MLISMEAAISGLAPQDVKILFFDQPWWSNFAQTL